MNGDYFDYKKYRKELARKIMEEKNREKRKEILVNAQQTEEYQKAEALHQKEREKFLSERKEELPILRYKEKIKEVISSNPISIIVGETGSGKTTQIPLFLLEIIPPEAKIAITQPRRVAARSVARYVAERIGCNIGEEVGYQVRFDDHTTEGTRINFMTDGILLRKIQEDPLLQEYSVVMVDEAHERSLNIDFILGLLKKIQKERERAGLTPLKIIISSATLEKEKFSTYFSGAPVVEIPGRLFPIEIHYEEKPVYDYPRAAAEKVKMIIEQNKPGDILIFMPGWEEILSTIKHIEALDIKDILILPLHGDMNPEDQDKIFLPSDKRKVIVATNIAETSVTVPGVRYVIDSGLIKQLVFNPATGIESLVVQPHAKSGCIQRAGRAGRIAPGECWRLYTRENFEGRPDFQTPEIKRSNITHVILMMKKIGIDDIESFEFIDPPEPKALKQAIETLKILGALDNNERITEIGEIMAELPLEPHVARMVIEAQKYGCVSAICTIAAFLGNRSVFVRPKGKESEADRIHKNFRVPKSDFLTLLKVWHEYEANHFQDTWARANFLNSKVLNEVRQIRYQLFNILRRNKIPISTADDPESIQKAVAAGLIENLMEHYYKYSYRRIRDGQKDIYIHPSSVVFGEIPKFFVAAEIIQTSKTYARMIQVVEPDWLKEIALHLVSEKIREIYYDPLNDEVVEIVDTYLKGDSSPFMMEKRKVTEERAVEVFAQALSEGKIDLPFVQHNKEIISYIRTLWLKSEGKIGTLFSDETLIDFYKERLGTISSKKELEEALNEGRINLMLNIDDFVSPELREEILRNNPDFIEILGVKRPVKYRFDSLQHAFIASVKIPIEDILKLEELPTLPSGKQIVVEGVISETSQYPEFSGSELDELKKKAREFLIKRQWDDWRYNNRDIQRQFLENFDPLAEPILLPEPIQFGVDPETKEPLFAFPAIKVETSYGGNIRYYIEYFPSAEEAEKVHKKFLEVRERLLQEKIKKELQSQAEKLLQEIGPLFDVIINNYNYHDYGIDLYEVRDLQREWRYIKLEINSNPEEALQTLHRIKTRIDQAIEYKEAKERAIERAKYAIDEYFGICPLCGSYLQEGECRNFDQHDISLIDFDVDDEGYEISPVILSQIVTDKGEIIAQMLANLRGYIYVIRWNDIRENGWREEPFESLKIENFNRILTPEQAKERKEKLFKLRQEKEKAKVLAIYQEALDYAQSQVEEGYWKKGKFIRGVNPKTGESQWELTINDKGLTIKYVVDRRSRQPTSENFEYFFSEGRTLVDTPRFKLVLVWLEEPFPEDKPL